LSDRRFVAVWPPAEVLDAVEVLHRPVAEGGRWTRRDQWHVTLRFLGDVPLDDVVSALEGVGSGPVEATLGPAVGRLGRGVVQVPVAGLEDLAADVVRRTADLGRPPDDRPFRGHLTLARIAGRPPKGVLRQPISATFPVDAVHVVASHLGGTAARYETEASIPLRRSSR
jgi:RNA 2',3'-cyclic 3'-phosphodiesterase